MRAGIALIAAALLVALVPTPPGLVERWYSTGIYPTMQATATSLSNRAPLAFGDFALGALLAIGIAGFVYRLRRSGLRAALVRGGGRLLVTSAAMYLVFVFVWGLNYRRVPLEERLDYDRSRISGAAALDLARRSVAMLNEGHAAAHALTTDLSRLDAAFAAAQHDLGAARAAVAGRPKASVLTWYFRYAAIDGMTDPFFFEVVVNADVPDVERPFVVAHEWAHLAGYAVEAEANFVSWLTCLRGDPLARYSGWLAAYERVAGVLSRDERRTLKLDPGPIADLRAGYERYQRSSPVVRTAAREVNDRYLKANRVAEGVGSYEAVLRLMLGTRFDGDGRPALRRAQ